MQAPSSGPRSHGQPLEARLLLAVPSWHTRRILYALPWTGCCTLLVYVIGGLRSPMNEVEGQLGGDLPPPPPKYYTTSLTYTHNPVSFDALPCPAIKTSPN